MSNRALRAESATGSPTLASWRAMGKVTIGAAEPLVNPVLLQAIVFTACSFSGILAGIDIDGCSVRFPAWLHLGAAAWLKRSGNDTQVVEDAFEGLRAGASFAPLLRCLHLP